MLTEDQYRQIIHSYDVTRERNRILTQEKREEIDRKVPQLRELENAFTAAAIAAARAELADQTAKARQIREQIPGIREKIREALRQGGYGPEDLDPIYTCGECRDTGYVQMPDGRKEKCRCLLNKETEILYDQCGIREQIREQNFDRIRYDHLKGEDLEHFRGAVDICRDFAETFDASYKNLVFYGTVGTGKSFLSCCIAAELLKTMHSVIYLSSQRLFDTLADLSFGDPDRAERFRYSSQLYGCDLLILDDLGTELPNSFVASRLFECMNERDLRRKSTIISTNLSLADIRDRYSDRVLSRLTGGYTFIKLSGPDYRMTGRR